MAEPPVSPPTVIMPADSPKVVFRGPVHTRREGVLSSWSSRVAVLYSDAYLVLFNDDSEKDYFVRFSIRPNIFSVVPKTKTQIMFKIPKGIRGNLLLFMKVPSDGERDLWMSALQRVCPSPSSQSLFPSPSAGNELSPERSANRSPKHTRSRSVSSAPVPSPKVAGVPAMLTPPSTATNIRRSMSNLSAVLDHPENDGSLFCAESHSKCVQAAEQLQNAVKDSKDAQLQRLVGSLIEALALYSSDVNIESQRLKDEIRGLKEASGTLNQTVVEMGQQMHRLEKLGFRMSRYGSKERPGARGDESPEESDNDDEFFDAVDAQISSRRTSLKSLARAPTVNLIEQMAKEPPTFRTELPADKSDRKLSVWKFLKDNIGKDFSKISMPIVLNEPISAVQRVCEDLEPAFLLTQAASCQDPDERLLYIAIFSIAAYKNTSRTGKPFNPLLGETFELDLSNVKGYEYRAVAEQVSHHPPVTAVHAQGKGWRWWKQVDIKNKFRGKSMEVYPTGTIHVLIGDEHYTWDCVTSVVNNLVVGTLWVDQYGPMTIKNHKTGACAKLNFKAYSYFGSSEVGAVDGVVCDVSGKEVYQIEANCHDFARARRTDSPNGNFVEYWVKQPLPPKSAQQFNFSRFTMLLNEMRDEYKGVIAPTDSRYRPDLHLYEEGNLDQAQDEKTRLEEKQRAVRRAREARGEEWTPLWFEEQKDKDLGTVCWMLSLSESRDYWAHRKSKDWKGSPDLY
eukprot:comp23550_c0_seq2/m.39764 comp23550_c0_seq2/g.39764  ORF comp23550_c0_seq2/g.39764 comp23550_c0_seq2/m.39764 type:complete len:735 (-) comp23550_c0_seq2:217-2421(-)